MVKHIVLIHKCFQNFQALFYTVLTHFMKMAKQFYNSFFVPTIAKINTYFHNMIINYWSTQGKLKTVAANFGSRLICEVLQS